MTEPQRGVDDVHFSTARRPRRERPQPLSTTFELAVIDGPDAGSTFPIEPPARSAHLVGRSATCHVRLSDPTVAARHCSLEAAGQAVRLLDLAGETRVNGVLAIEAFLSGGEVVRVGATAIEVRRRRLDSDSAPALGSFGRLLGESRAMAAIHPALLELARTRVPVLIEGERGTGKRLAAEELTRLGPRAHAGLSVVERGRTPDAISTLATIAGVGPALGGSLFIADIDELDDEGQCSLAAQLAACPDVRVIAGSRGARPLLPELTRSFARVHLPPLREREGDVTLLARRFWSELDGDATGRSGLPDDFAPHFDGHGWPGNVRELRMAVRDRFLHGRDTEAPVELSSPAPADEHDALDTVLARDLPFVDARSEVLAEFERRYVEHALERSGSVARAAVASGIAQRYFQVLRARRRRF